VLLHPAAGWRGASVDAVVPSAAAALGWVCVCWLAACVVLSAAACLPGVCGRISARIGAAITPAVVCRTVEAAVGLTVASVPVVTPWVANAHADSGRARFDLAVPSLDRPAGEVPPPVHLPAGATPAHSPRPSLYVVRQGDCLWTIAARQLGARATVDTVAATWPRWYAANHAVIGADPNVVHPGQRLVVPEERA
jgi:nucleoid-associated protein YgaU